MSLHTYMHLHAMWGAEQKQNSFHDQSGSLYYLVHEQCVYLWDQQHCSAPSISKCCPLNTRRGSRSALRTQPYAGKG